jgi:hypothetical protein
VLVLLRDDLKKIPERERKHIRYFTIHQLANAGYNADQLLTYRNGLSKLVNSLSWGRRIKNPEPIDPGATILRIDLRDYLWTPEVWESIRDVYPYGVKLPGSTGEWLCTSAETELPMVRADWFVFAASRPPLYHKMLQLPEQEKDLAWKVNVDVGANIKQERVARAGFNESGISRNNRLLERHESSFGAYWRSYDFSGNADRRNLFSHPLGPAGMVPPDDEAYAFEPDGGEIIFTLPNGLNGYMLVDGSGGRIDQGPLSIVRDTRQAESAVVTGISCMSCHVRGLIPKGDQVRELVAKSGVFSKKVSATVMALYPEPAQWEKTFEEDNARFLSAVQSTGAAAATTEPVFALARQFEQDVEPALVAAEGGLELEAFKALLKRTPELSQELGLVLVGGNVKRDVVLTCFSRIAAARGLEFLAPSASKSKSIASRGAAPKATQGRERPSMAGAQSPGRMVGTPAPKATSPFDTPGRMNPMPGRMNPMPGRMNPMPGRMGFEQDGFRDQAPKGGILVGFNVTFSKFIDKPTIGSLQPVYKVGGRTVTGKRYGRTNVLGSESVTAKPGYAVGELHVRTGLSVDGFEVVFMRIKGDRLDPDDNYVSKWLGNQTGGSPATVSTDGKVPVGINGRADKVLKRLSLAVDSDEP